MSIRTFWLLLTETFRQWSADKPFRLAAALAYYTLFSLAPLPLRGSPSGARRPSSRS
jgi:membrane protein